MLPGDEFFLLLLYHLCIDLIPLQSIRSLLDHLSSFGLLGDQVANLSEVVGEVLLFISSLLCLNMSHHSGLGKHVLSLNAIGVLCPQVPNKVLLFAIKLLIHLQVLFLLELEDVFHDLGHMASFCNVLFA
jgi:hypothetical protein